MAFKKGDLDDSDIDNVISKFNLLPKDDKIKLISYFVNEVKRLHNLSEEEIKGIFHEISAKPKEISIPVGIFANDVLGSLEAIVKYLKEEQKLKFSKIGKLLNRSNKTIWTSYHNSIKKMPSSFGAVSTNILIPVYVFTNRLFSTLESLVGFIKDLDYSNHEVALMLQLDDRTIWTVYDRVKKKRGM